MDPKKFGSKKNLGQKPILGPKNFGAKKIVGPKKFESAKYFESKFLGPPFLRYGGLDN